VWTDLGNIQIAHRHMNEEIGTEAAHFLSGNTQIGFSLQCAGHLRGVQQRMVADWEASVQASGQQPRHSWGSNSTKIKWILILSAYLTFPIPGPLNTLTKYLQEILSR
jgi:hypothetical protein